MHVPFLDLKRQYLELKPQIDRSISEVLHSGTYILGSRVQEFEHAFASYCQCAYGVGVASGTDAIYLALRSWEIGPGDEVITAPLTAFATVAAILKTGAVPAFADVEEDTLTLDPDAVSAVIGPNTRAIVAVDLYGCPSRLPALYSIAEKKGIILIEDACQAHGSQIGDRRAGSFGHAACFSFYPTKNLGGFGDGGMVVTQNRGVAERIRMLRNYGETSRFKSELPGVNSRLDELQAAILNVKLAYLDEWNQRRCSLAQAYRERIAGLGIQLPSEPEGTCSNFHLFVVRSPRRDSLIDFLKSRGIETAVHYPTLAYRQPVFHGSATDPCCPVAEREIGKILSLPLYPQINPGELVAVCNAIREFGR
ncbi:MAG: DegT/DnrJ/EryC1/StrS family aminotransferase [Acidobacteria bacterium]|nr:DegT/DnrJ/EryC1/StrS family aminotransferase [Acidobacteriota bacterium]